MLLLNVNIRYVMHLCKSAVVSTEAQIILCVCGDGNSMGLCLPIISIVSWDHSMRTK